MKILLFYFVQFLAWAASEIVDTPDSNKNQFTALSKSVSAFNSKMFEKISEIENGNIFYSPLGLHMALFQVYLGAPKNLTARQELARLFEIDSEEDIEYLNNYQNVLAFHDIQSSDQNQQIVVRIANRMYAAANLQIKSQFKNLTGQYLKSTIEEVNFFKSEETVGKINNFVNNATNSLIKKALDQVSPDTRLILVNAIYFKGPWKYPFIETLTKPRDFYIDNSTKIQAISMYSDDLLNVKYFPELESDVLHLPYNNEKMSMIIILPDKTTDVLQVEKKLKNFETKLLVEKLQSTDRYTTETFLPKFELSLDLKDVTKTLKSLGVSSIFESNADLSNISEEDLFVSSIKHKAVVKVDEEGTEAAAITTIGIQVTSEPKPEIFNVDRPFIFYIYDRVNHLQLFVGRVVDPTGKATPPLVKKD